MTRRTPQKAPVGSTNDDHARVFMIERHGDYRLSCRPDGQCQSSVSVPASTGYGMKLWSALQAERQNFGRENNVKMARRYTFENHFPTDCHYATESVVLPGRYVRAAPQSSRARGDNFAGRFEIFGRGADE